MNAKTVSFLIIDFLEFRHRFWRVLGFQVGAKLAIFADLGLSKRRTKFERIFDRIFLDLPAPSAGYAMAA